MTLMKTEVSNKVMNSVKERHHLCANAEGGHWTEL